MITNQSNEVYVKVNQMKILNDDEVRIMTMIVMINDE